jgi:hypothetical protein
VIGDFSRIPAQRYFIGQRSDEPPPSAAVEAAPDRSVMRVGSSDRHGTTHKVPYAVSNRVESLLRRLRPRRFLIMLA